jgi:hypothetical protein
MLLRRRDDLAMVMRELGGELFATEGDVDRLFDLMGSVPKPNDNAPQECRVDVVQQRRIIDTADIAERIQQHIRTAPEREAAALRKARESAGEGK